MNIVCWNINGLYATLKDAQFRYGSVSKYFSEILRAHIICFQETKLQEDKLEEWIACPPGYFSFWAFCSVKRGYSGIVTYVKEEISALDAKADFIEPLHDGIDVNLNKEGRVVETDHGSFVLLNVYVPNAGDAAEGRPRLGFKLEFLRALRHRCDVLVTSGRQILVLGDFNIAHKAIDVYKNWDVNEMYSKEEISWMDEFFKDYVDLFRHFHPDESYVFSNWSMVDGARIHDEGQRIDYAACSKGLVDQIIKADIVKMVPKSWSDHAAIILTLKDQPKLPEHSLPELGSMIINKFKGDHKQNKITAFFRKHPHMSMESRTESSGDAKRYFSLKDGESKCEMKIQDTNHTVKSSLGNVYQEAISNKIDELDKEEQNFGFPQTHLNETFSKADFGNQQQLKASESVQYGCNMQCTDGCGEAQMLSTDNDASKTPGKKQWKEMEEIVTDMGIPSSPSKLNLSNAIKNIEVASINNISSKNENSPQKTKFRSPGAPKPEGISSSSESKGWKKRKAKKDQFPGQKSKQKGLENYFKRERE